MLKFKLGCYTDRLEGRGPLDGSQPVGEGGEAVEVVCRVVVVAARLAIAVVAIGAGCTMLFIVAATLLPLGIVPLATAVVDAWSKVTTVEAGTGIRQVDLLLVAMRAYRAVGARLRPVVGVLLPQALNLGCCNVETSTGFLDLGSLGKTIEYLKNGGHVGGWRGEDLVAVIVQDELVLEVPGPWWRSTPSPNPRLQRSAFSRSSLPWPMTSLLAR